jgi:hypothetical protein
MGGMSTTGKHIASAHRWEQAIMGKVRAAGASAVIITARHPNEGRRLHG